jgi:sulfate transport system permease protein
MGRTLTSSNPSAGKPGQRFVIRRASSLPGFSLSLAYALLYLTLIVLLPLSALVLRASGLGLSGVLSIALDGRVAAALRLSFGLALAAALISSLAGLLVAWVLTRYRFPGRRLLDAIVDLPFALPTAVAGLALADLYSPKGWIGSWLDLLGVKIAYTPAGIAVAMIFVGLPFAVRTVQPVILELDREIEEAAATLGAPGSKPFAGFCCPSWSLRSSRDLRWPLRVRSASTGPSSSLPAICPMFRKLHRFSSSCVLRNTTTREQRPSRR